MDNNQLKWFTIKEFSEYETQINKYNSKITSQNGEDGMIKYIFNNIGTTNKKSCEFGFHSNEANTLLLMKNNWNCIFIDSDKKQINKFNNLYKLQFPLSKALYKTITKNNINSILKENDFIGEVDFLSIDIDGNDYYILDEITICNPRCICIEYNASLGPHISCTVPYNSIRPNQTIDYWGASYKALIELANKKNYNLVAVVAGLNLFFVRKDIKLNNLEVLKNAWQPPKNSTYTNNIPRSLDRLKIQYNKIKNLKWNYI